MFTSRGGGTHPPRLLLFLLLPIFVKYVTASIGDKLPEFQECISVWHHFRASV